jgi:hypothetical protein
VAVTVLTGPSVRAWHHSGIVVAAALTLWLMFALWVAAPALEVSRGVARTAVALLTAELVALLCWSYGCEFECSPAADVAGTAARTDIPVLAFVFVGALLAQRVRAALS